MKRLSMQSLRQIIRQVMETLPPEFTPYLDNVVIDVEEEPSEETLREMGFTEEEIRAGETLYGLFVPLEVPAWGGDVVDIHDLPHRIIIYKRPLEEDFPDREELLDQIRKTVIHELAHHFGYTDRDLEKWTDVY